MLTDKEIEERLTSPDNLANRLSIHHKKTRSTNIPQEIRNTAAILYHENNLTQKEISEIFGTSRSNIENYVGGTVGSSTSKIPNEELKGFIDTAKNKRVQAEGQAIDILMGSLEVLQPLLPEIKKPKQLTQIAKDMAIVAEKLRGSNGGEPQNAGVHLHLHVPKTKTIKDYEVIDVNS